MLPHHVVESLLSAMSKWRMSKIVAEANSFNEIKVWKCFFARARKIVFHKLKHNPMSNLGNFHGVSKPRAVEISLPNSQDLCLRL